MMESPIVEFECLPFSSIPHTSRLFDDYLHQFDKVSALYARSPQIESWWRDEAAKIEYPPDRRQAVAAILERQNLGFGASDKALANIQRLREGAPVVVTGQQVGLFGGPLFCVLKALSAAMHAEKTGAVPVFWLATEDHDYAEISSANLPAADHLKKFTVNVPHKEGAPVGSITFDDEITAAVKQVEALFGNSEVTELLAASYAKGEDFGSAFAKFYAKVLGDLGIVLLNPSDPELHRIVKPLFKSALERAEEINDALLQRGKDLEAAGYHAQVKVTTSHTLCFFIQDGVRTPIRIEDGAFLIADHKLTRKEILEEAERCPEKFSANVLLRPLTQDHLLPTLCYIGGPAEVAYFAQIETVYRKLANRVTPVIPRIFATVVEPRQAKLLDRYELNPTDIFCGPDQVRETLAAHALPDSIVKSFDSADQHLEQAITSIQQPLQKLDKTLADAAEHAASKMRYQLQALRDKAARAEARKNGELQRHADELSTLLYPNKDLQEREVGAAYFLLKYGTGFVAQLKTLLRADCVEHQVVPFQPA
jgi:bacillithiol synthase